MLTYSINCCIKSNRHCNVRLKRLITRLSELPEKRFRYPWEIKVIFAALFWSLKHAALFKTTHSFQHHSKTDNLYFWCLTVRNTSKKSMILFWWCSFKEATSEDWSITCSCSHESLRPVRLLVSLGRKAQDLVGDQTVGISSPLTMTQMKWSNLSKGIKEWKRIVELKVSQKETSHDKRIQSRSKKVQLLH